MLQPVGYLSEVVVAKLLIYVPLPVEATDGCVSVAVSTVGCGPAGPGSSPGHGPKSHSRFTLLGLLWQCHAPSC